MEDAAIPTLFEVTVVEGYVEVMVDNAIRGFI